VEAEVETGRIGQQTQKQAGVEVVVAGTICVEHLLV